MATNPPPTNKRIAHQKKAQAGFSLVGGTLGLAALASRGKAGQLSRRAGKVNGNAYKEQLMGASQKWKDRSTALTTAGAGVGGVGAYNFASYTNAEANQNKKRIKKSSSVSAFGVDHGHNQVSKLGSPKVTLQLDTAHEQSPRGEMKVYHPNRVETSYKGKSKVLRRDQYKARGYPGRLDEKKEFKGSKTSMTFPNSALHRKGRKQVAEAHRTNAKTLDFGGGAMPHRVKKSAFEVDHGYEN